MFSPFVLLCLATDLNNCQAFSGPVYPTEEQCYSAMINEGVPYLLLTRPNAIFVDGVCYQWPSEA